MFNCNSLVVSFMFHEIYTFNTSFDHIYIPSGVKEEIRTISLLLHSAGQYIINIFHLCKYDISYLKSSKWTYLFHFNQIKYISSLKSWKEQCIVSKHLFYCTTTWSFPSPCNMAGHKGVGFITVFVPLMTDMTEDTKLHLTILTVKTDTLHPPLCHVKYQLSVKENMAFL